MKRIVIMVIIVLLHLQLAFAKPPSPIQALINQAKDNLEDFRVASGIDDMEIAIRVNPGMTFPKSVDNLFRQERLPFVLKWAQITQC